MLITRNEQEIKEFFTRVEESLLSAEVSFSDKTYTQGLLDALMYLSGQEENPFDREETL